VALPSRQSRGRKHARIDIDADNRTGPPDPFGREPSDDTCAASDVEQVLARPQRGNIEEIVPPQGPKITGTRYAS